MDKSESHKPQYGLISMISIIVGTVIGSGIYVKNASIMEVTQSAILAAVAWIIAGLLVLAILIAFLEIASITTKRNEQGTLNTWTRYFWGPKTSMVVSIYFLFIYFPLVAASETVFAVNELFEAQSFSNSINAFFIVTAISLVLLVITFSLSTYFLRTTKTLMGTGSITKLVPLFLVIILMVLIGVGLKVSPNVDQLNPIFKPGDSINDGLSKGVFTSFSRVLLVLPAILFAFDGFLYSASLSTEAKSPKTYKMAAIISIMIITSVYIAFSLSSYALANTSDGHDAYQITNVMSNVFPDSSWIITAISIIVALSILTAVFGYSITAMWTLSDASNTNEIVDSNGNLIKRYKNGNPYKAGLYVLLFAIIALLIIRGYDLISLLVAATDDDIGNGVYIGMTDYISNLYTIINFSFYTLIISGALLNRKTKKVDVDKSSLFIGAAIFAILGMSFVVIDMSYDIFYTLIGGIISNERTELNSSLIELSSIVLIFSLMFIIYHYQSQNIKKQPLETWANKIPYQQAYNHHMSYQEYIESISRNNKK